MEPFVVKWNPPLFDRRNDLDPTKLRKAGRPPQHSADRLLDVLVDGMKSGEWEEAAKGKGIKSNATYLRLREELEPPARSKNEVKDGGIPTNPNNPRNYLWGKWDVNSHLPIYL